MSEREVVAGDIDAEHGSLQAIPSEMNADREPELRCSHVGKAQQQAREQNVGASDEALRALRDRLRVQRYENKRGDDGRYPGAILRPELLKHVAPHERFLRHNIEEADDQT